MKHLKFAFKLYIVSNFLSEFFSESSFAGVS